MPPKKSGPSKKTGATQKKRQAQATAQGERTESQRARTAARIQRENAQAEDGHRERDREQAIRRSNESERLGTSYAENPPSRAERLHTFLVLCQWHETRRDIRERDSLFPSPILSSSDREHSARVLRYSKKAWRDLPIYPAYGVTRHEIIYWMKECYPGIPDPDIWATIKEAIDKRLVDFLERRHEHVTRTIDRIGELLDRFGLDGVDINGATIGIKVLRLSHKGERFLEADRHVCDNADGADGGPKPTERQRKSDTGKRTGAKIKTPKKKTRRRTPALTDKQKEALEVYGREQTYEAVGKHLNISRQAATELVNKAKKNLEAIEASANAAGQGKGTSVRANQKLPEGKRGEPDVADVE